MKSDVKAILKGKEYTIKEDRGNGWLLSRKIKGQRKPLLVLASKKEVEIVGIS